jgi:hypothetical protein
MHDGREATSADLANIISFSCRITPIANGEHGVLFDLPRWLFGLPGTFIDHSGKTYMAHWTPNSSSQMQSF